MSKVQTTQTNLREKLAELLDFRKMRDRLSGLGLYIGKDRTNTDENLLVRGGANVDDLQLAEISASVGGTTVDVFVYDTGRDSDGGAWRKRTQHASWYNEELNTATRGARREFPAVAVIVAEASKVTIYDGDDPDLSMWMVFEVTMNMNLITATTGSIVSSLYALNGVLCVGVNGSSPHLTPIDFISEKSGHYTIAGNKYFLFDISKRNNTSSPAHGSYDSTVAIINSSVNDIAMTVLPNAPIDYETGLPVPTIAVATDGGVSVIKDDGTVVDIVSDNPNGETPLKVDFRGRLLYLLLGSKEDISNTWNSVSTIYIPDGDVLTTYRGDSGDYIAQYSRYNGLPFSEPGNSGHDMLVPINSQAHLPTAQRSRAINVLGTDHLYIGGEGSEDKAGGVVAISENLTNPKNGLIAHTTSKYNTGWMPGDIKLAALSDSVVENVGVNSDELVVNSDFVDTNNDGADNWTLRNGVITSTSGTTVTITNGVVDFGYIFQVISTEIGKKYKFTVDVDYTGHNGRVLLGKNDTSSSGETYFKEENIGSDKTIQYYFTATTEAVSVRIGLTNSSINQSIQYSNISLVETTELITNGDFSNGVTPWTEYDPNNHVSVSHLSSGKLRIKCDTITSGAVWVAQSIDNFILGKTYVVSADITISGTATASVMLHDDWIADFPTITSSGHYSFTFKPVQTQHEVRATAYVGFTAGSTIDFDNISVRPAEEDRSVNGNGLQIIGEINKTPVASGADLVAYSGFSANNYLVQPYNEDLNFGTGDLHMMCWHKKQITGNNEILINKSGTSAGQYGASLGLQHSGSKYYAYTTGGDGGPSGTNDYLEAPFATDNTWHHVAMVRKDGVLTIYVDGVTIGYGTRNYNVNNSGDCFVGVANGVAPAATSSLALIRIGGSAPTAEQIAKIYRDEKVLFQEGAQATLYGTSDAVTALAYDDSEQLLHVGTASGRSDFRGLARVNNTTTAISNSISAAEGTIIQN